MDDSLHCVQTASADPDCSCYIFGRPFVKWFALCYRTVVCPVLSVCDVGVVWPNGLTDQDETWYAGRPRPWPHCVRSGPSSHSPKGTQPPIFGPYPLRPNACIDQDSTWYGGRPRPGATLCSMGTPLPLPKRGRAPLKKLGPCLAHVYCGQTAGWIKMVLGTEVGLSPCDLVVLDENPVPSPKRGQSPLPNFWPISIVAKRLDAP